MLPLIRVFGLTIQAPLLVILFGYMLGLMFSSRVGADLGMDGNAIIDAGFYGLVIGVLGGRIGFVLQNLQVYIREPLSALMPSTTALLPIAGWITGIVYVAAFFLRKRMLCWQLLDVLAPGVVLFLAGMAGGSLLSGDAYGLEAQLPWAIYLMDAWRHPVQVYELIALLAIFVVMYMALRSKMPVGSTVLLLLGLYGFTRVIVDAYRVEAVLLAGMRVTQLAGVVVGVGSFLVLSFLRHDGNSEPSLPGSTKTGN